MIVLGLCVFILLQLVGCQDIIATITTATSTTANAKQESVITTTKYVYDTMNNEMVRDLVSSTSDIISTIAGNGNTAYSGDNGAATSAAIYYPCGVALDASGRPRHSI